jgi:hypothetical protein
VKEPFPPAIRFREQFRRTVFVRAEIQTKPLKMLAFLLQSKSASPPAAFLPILF